MDTIENADNNGGKKENDDEDDDVDGNIDDDYGDGDFRVAIFLQLEDCDGSKYACCAI